MRVAAFQRFAIFDDPARVSETVLRDLRWADRHGVDIAIFPECYLQGHSYERSLIERRAVSLDGPVVRELIDRASGISATVILGLFERRDCMTCNSAVVIGNGRILGVPTRGGMLARHRISRVDQGTLALRYQYL